MADISKLNLTGSDLDIKDSVARQKLTVVDPTEGEGLITFGVDANGNYGYKKVGADTVTPFLSGGSLNITTNNGGYTTSTYGRNIYFYPSQYNPTTPFNTGIYANKQSNTDFIFIVYGTHMKYIRLFQYDSNNNIIYLTEQLNNYLMRKSLSGLIISYYNGKLINDAIQNAPIYMEASGTSSSNPNYQISSTDVIWLN